MKPARVKWIENRFPLIEARITRADCIAWFKARMYPVPGKSACTFCPYRDDHGWRDMRDNDPGAWADAVAVDRAIRERTIRGTTHQLYIHRSGIPLEHVDLRTAEEAGQLDMFGNECEGMCGV
jgi:hypothetical protein